MRFWKTATLLPEILGEELEASPPDNHAQQMIHDAVLQYYLSCRTLLQSMYNPWKKKQNQISIVSENTNVDLEDKGNDDTIFPKAVQASTTTTKDKSAATPVSDESLDVTVILFDSSDMALIELLITTPNMPSSQPLSEITLKETS